MKKILVVCMGNICRSPMAHGLLLASAAQHKLENRFHIDSAGTHSYHAGEAPDPRAQETMRAHGIDISKQKSRQIYEKDYHYFDLILYMDDLNESKLESRCPPQERHKLKRILSYAPQFGTNVPDPYYGAANGFEQVYDMLKQACDTIITVEKESL